MRVYGFRIDIIIRHRHAPYYQQSDMIIGGFVFAAIFYKC